MRIIVCGAGGRMGQTILKLAKEDGGIEIAGAVEADGNSLIGKGDPAIIGSCGLEKILPESDVLIDFTNAESALIALKKAEKFKKAAVIGATGFNAAQKEEVISISKNIPIILSPNMSIGVNFLFKIAEIAARTLSDYDMEILELHHNKKKDAPSGTAARLAEIISSVLEKDLNETAVYERHSLNKARSRDEIGIMSLRAGDIVGEHTVYFAGPGERIELTHIAQSRDTFASGALKAAKWLIGKKPKLYDMSDVLRL
ncbi:MAG: 4-hydroxy-tetrahydrodipicolinate reductase [Elusimicrobiota bacterium]|jgi:4-hydroxy-tetrahydrodipicolinate reductase|nr:4-hydroxy-tetrahydrodipicolinate reductase [Elusimicrobiota bacterium]